MPRIRLNPLSEYSFVTEITVRLTDLNYGGHLGNDRMLSLIHEARGAFLAEQGFSELDCGGISLTMGDAAVVYLGEALAGEVLRFEVAAGEVSTSGFRIFYRVTRPADGTSVALAETGMVGFDYHTRKICSIPDPVKKMCVKHRPTS